MRYLFAKEPKIAKEFAVKGKAFDKLPEHVKKPRKAKKKG